MKETLKLKNPIMINNSSVSELTYDTNEITAAMFSEAEARKNVAANKNVAIVPAAEFDFSLHLYLFFAAVVAVNPGYDFADVERIHGADVVKAMAIGRDFILGSEKSEGSKSDEPSEPTVKPSTQASPISKEKG